MSVKYFVRTENKEIKEIVSPLTMFTEFAKDSCQSLYLRGIIFTYYMYIYSNPQARVNSEGLGRKKTRF